MHIVYLFENHELGETFLWLSPIIIVSRRSSFSHSTQDATHHVGIFEKSRIHILYICYSYVLLTTKNPLLLLSITYSILIASKFQTREVEFFLQKLLYSQYYTQIHMHNSWSRYRKVEWSDGLPSLPLPLFSLQRWVFASWFN